MTLLEMFNKHLIELVRLNKDGSYTPGDKWSPATHRIEVTRWNVREKHQNPKMQIRADKVRPRGLALAVCAVPLRRPVYRGTIKRKHINRSPERSVFSVTCSLEAKRRILCELLPKKARTTLLLPHAKLNALYRSIRHAEIHAR